MDTPEKENFLETVRELRKEADEKLTGNRHYLAIQKLDEITEVVEKSHMSPQEIEAVSTVLKGQADFAEASSEEESLSAAAVTAGAGLAGAGAAIVTGLSEDSEAATETAVETPSSADSPSIEEEISVLEGEGSKIVSSEKVLPNWWKDKDGDGAQGETGAGVEVAVEEAGPEMDETAALSTDEGSDLSGATAAAATGVAALATGAIVSDVVTEPVEAVEVAEEIEFIEVPEVVIETSDADLPVIDIGAIEPDVQPDADLETAPVILQDEVQDGAPEAIVLDADASVLTEAGSSELAALEGDPVEPVETIEPIGEPVGEVDLVEEMLADDLMKDVVSELPEGIPELPVPEGVVPEGAVPDMAVPDPAVPEVALPEVELPEVSMPEVSMPEVETPEAVAPIETSEGSDLIPEIDLGAQAVAVAAGAAATVAAVSAIASKSTEESTDEGIIEGTNGIADPGVPEDLPVKAALEPAPEPEPQAAPVPQVPEKLSFPNEPVVEEMSDPDAPAVTVLTGNTIKRHPAYGGSRGGFLTRFVNTLRGKDFI